jgi:hypothetical protein
MTTMSPSPVQYDASSSPIAPLAQPRAGSSFGAKAFALVGVLLSIGIVFASFVRPWYLRWGTTSLEALIELPGDEILPKTGSRATRAITIHAPADRVWPWLAQIGQDRGGFYSYDLLENLVGCRMPTVDVLRPDKQSWQLGDKLWMYPPDKAGGIGFATLRSYIPGRALGFATRMTGTPLTAPEDGSWSFVLLPLGDSASRLVVRGRGAPGRSLLGVAFDRSIFEPAHFAMERRMMVGLAQLAESGSRHRLANHAQVLLWMITFGLFVAAIVMVFGRRRWGLALVGVGASATVFQILTLRQPPPSVGAFLVAALIALLWWPRRPTVSAGGVG